MPCFSLWTPGLFRPFSVFEFSFRYLCSCLAILDEHAFGLAVDIGTFSLLIAVVVPFGKRSLTQPVDIGASEHHLAVVVPGLVDPVFHHITISVFNADILLLQFSIGVFVLYFLVLGACGKRKNEESRKKR